MTDYPYSQQIHDKVLADWANIPIEEIRFDHNHVSHPSVSYKLWDGALGLYPENLVFNLTKEHSENLYKEILDKPRKELERRRNELALKQFLGLE